ncbi:MAG: response regulator [Nannocystaceae bacterium]|nr:response regulator [Nannocystaceae bacterium]
MSRPTVLFAHERRSVARAVARVLEIAGFDVVVAAGGTQTRALLKRQRWAALVVDVALPQVPGYELCADARSEEAGQGADVVVLVASVYRRTSYKRQPTRLYGADDYVEIHHLCDSLPVKLLQHLGLKESESVPDEEAVAREALRVEGDARMSETGQQTLASLIVADMVLYNGDAIFAARSLAEALVAVSRDLDVARELHAQVEQAEGRGGETGDPVGDAFAQLMVSMGRAAHDERLPVVGGRG